MHLPGQGKRGIPALATIVPLAVFTVNPQDILGLLDSFTLGQQIKEFQHTFLSASPVLAPDRSPRTSGRADREPGIDLFGDVEDPPGNGYIIKGVELMNEIVPEGKYTPSNVLTKQGVTAIGCLIGGAGLLVLGVLPSIVGIIAGGVVVVVGISALRSKDPEDRKPGLMLTIAGGLTILSKVGIKGFGTLLGIGAVGLLAMGIWKGIQFFRGLKSRA